MKLFSRQIHLRGTPQEVMGFHTEMQKFASEVSGREIALWNMVLGAPNGTVSYTTGVEGLSDVAQMMGSIIGHADYPDKVAWAVDRVMVPSQDTVATVLHGDISGGRPAVGSFGVVTSVLVGNGQYENAIGWGIEMAQFASEVGGLPVLFTMDGFGEFGRVNWISVGPDEGAVESSLDALTANAEYVKRMGQTTDLFVPGSATRVLGYRAA